VRWWLLGKDSKENLLRQTVPISSGLFLREALVFLQRYASVLPEKRKRRPIYYKKKEELK